MLYAIGSSAQRAVAPRCCSAQAAITLIAGMAMACVAPSVRAGEFKLVSADIAAQGEIAHKFVYDGYGCRGGNVSPALSWSGAPPHTRSFALLVYDPDAATARPGWWHWVVYNIPADVHEIVQGAGSASGARLPKGAVQARSDFGTTGWGGPCPPGGQGKHHYLFTLYALKVERLPVPEAAGAALINRVAGANALATAAMTGLYGRQAASAGATGP